MKFCKDCDYNIGLYCHRPDGGRTDRVTGATKPVLCDDERSPGWFIALVEGMCGEAGRYYRQHIATDSELDAKYGRHGWFRSQSGLVCRVPPRPPIPPGPPPRKS